MGTFPQLGEGATQALSASYASLASGTYFFHVRAVDAAGRLGDTAHFKVGVTAALSKENVYNYPNPSRDGRTAIRFPLLQPSGVNIRIYDETGALVWSRDLSAADTVAGVNAVEWDGRNGNGQPVANGGYIYTLSSGSFTVTKKIAIIR
jgi:flagellar hook assembly protein FlgD